MNDYRNEEDACLVVFCEFGSEQEKRFIVPISFLEREILTRAFLDERGRHTFAVSKNTFVFTWQHGVHMDGKQFLDESNFQLPGGTAGFTDYE